MLLNADSATCNGHTGRKKVYTQGVSAHAGGYPDTIKCSALLLSLVSAASREVLIVRRVIGRAV